MNVKVRYISFTGNWRTIFYIYCFITRYLIILAALSLILNMDSPKLTVTSISGILSSDLTPHCVFVSICIYGSN